MEKDKEKEVENKKEIRSRNVMYTQQVDHLKIKAENLSSILKKTRAEEWAFILHDKDDEVKPHYHVILHYRNAVRLSTVAHIFNDDPQYVDKWNNHWNNACAYLIHITKDALKEGKHRYDVDEVTANFEYNEKIASIIDKFNNDRVHGADKVAKMITEYGNHEMSRSQLQSKIGDAEMTRNHVWIQRIDDLNSKRRHERFLKAFDGKAQETIWLWGSAGVGKSRYADYLLRGKETAKLGSSRDYFQDYNGENYVILNDLRPNEFTYADLLRLTDPYQHDKAAPRRYHDLKLNLKVLIITSPYSPDEFYEYCHIQNYRIDTFEQLNRRIHTIHVTAELMKQVMPDEFKDTDEFSDLLGF